MKPFKSMKKEQTYGWYPAVRDIYLSKNEPTPYHLECLYKFKGSGYYNPIIEPPEPAFIIRGITPTPPPHTSRPATSRPGTCRSSARGAHNKPQRPKSVPVPKFTPVPKGGIPTPKWKRAPEETAWGVDTPLPPTPDCHSPAQEEQTEVQVQWPSQQIMGKYDKPFVPSSVAEEVFGTPLPPRDPGSGGDTGYVFIPTGDGGVQVYSPPVVNWPDGVQLDSPGEVIWPDNHPRTPTPQHSVSSRASLGSSEGMMARKKAQDEYLQQRQKEKDEKKRKMERQRRFDNMLRQQQYQHSKQQQQPQPPATARSSPSVRRERIQSATTYRRKANVPERPVCSARPSRPASDSAVCTNRAYQDKMAASDAERYRAWEENKEEEATPRRPMAPLPPTPSLEDLAIQEDRSPSPDYQQTVDTFGWRAQVHGDPYNIKKTTKRLPYTVQCEEPVLAPEPPSVHMESKETFFLNTIPRRHATFQVHADWLSEGLHAKRIELQKRDGVNYRYKTFGFAY